MSDYESIEGIIKSIPRKENEIDKDYFERVTGSIYQKYNYSSDNIQEAIYDNNLDDKYIYINNQLYEFIEYRQINDYDSYCHLQKIDEDRIKFFTRFYNGGTCLSEMLESSLRKIK